MTTDPPLRVRSVHGSLIAPDMLEAIGRVVVSCSNLEGQARRSVAAFAGLSAEANVMLLNAESHSRLLQILRAYTKRSDDHGLAERWRDWLGAVEKVAERRNDVVHAMWVIIGGSEVGRVVTPRRKPGYYVPYSSEALTELTAEATRLGATWYGLHNDSAPLYPSLG